MTQRMADCVSYMEGLDGECRALRAEVDALNDGQGGKLLNVEARIKQALWNEEAQTERLRQLVRGPAAEISQRRSRRGDLASAYWPPRSPACDASAGSPSHLHLRPIYAPSPSLLRPFSVPSSSHIHLRTFSTLPLRAAHPWQEASLTSMAPASSMATLDEMRAEVQATSARLAALEEVGAQREATAKQALAASQVGHGPSPPDAHGIPSHANPPSLARVRVRVRARPFACRFPRPSTHLCASVHTRGRRRSRRKSCYKSRKPGSR